MHGQTILAKQLKRALALHNHTDHRIAQPTLMTQSGVTLFVRGLKGLSISGLIPYYNTNPNPFWLKDGRSPIQATEI